MKRLMAKVDDDTAAEVQRLADGMGMSVQRLLGILITIGVRSTGDTFASFGATLAELTGDKEPDDS